MAEARRRGFSFSSPSDRAGDYKGLDAYSLPEDGGNFEGVNGRVGFQYKFVPSESTPLTNAHKSQIVESLDRAMRHNPDLACWILITPEDFNKHQMNWLAQIQSARNVKFRIKHWGQKELANLIVNYPEHAMHIYEELVPGLRPPTFKEMCGRLIQNISSSSPHSDYYLRIFLNDGHQVDRALLDFVDNRESMLFCLLGTYGTGKSTVLEHLALTLGRRYVEDHRSRIPLLIRLKHVRGDKAFRYNVLMYLKDEYGMRLDFNTLQGLNASGRLIFLFDGLDEKHDTQRQRPSGRGLGDVFDFLSPCGKMIVSSRTEFFKSAVEERTELLGLQRPHALALKGNEVRSLDRRSEIAYVSLLGQDQVDWYVKKRMGRETEEMLARINSIYDLKDIVRRAVMLDMVCETVRHLDKNVEQILSGDLYDRYIVSHLEQDLRSGRFGGTVDEWKRAIAGLAEYMILHRDSRVHHSKITENILLPKGQEKRNFLYTSFLMRDGKGFYEFSHKSFLEYFAAYRMALDLQASQRGGLWNELSLCTDEQFEFLDQIIQSIWCQNLQSSDKLRREFLNLPHEKLVDKKPITCQEFSLFTNVTGYQALAPAMDVQGYAAVCWWDAIAYALWCRGQILTVGELAALIDRQLPHAGLASHDVPEESIFGVAGPGWEAKEVVSRGGLVILRGVKEWAWPMTMVESSWTRIGDRRGLCTYRLRRGGAMSTGVFRCAFMQVVM